uniref:Uncharacterized protein n=1 Tax=Trachydiscus minutus TaxID=1032745 RepID=A0A140F2Q5_9STRA|nr:hypothetical protein [Trachydiscus minutus]AML60689.1 hypothetical protein [Trachydiscus minutus]
MYKNLFNKIYGPYFLMLLLLIAVLYILRITTDYNIVSLSSTEWLAIQQLILQGFFFFYAIFFLSFLYTTYKDYYKMIAVYNKGWILFVNFVFFNGFLFILVGILPSYFFYNSAQLFSNIFLLNYSEFSQVPLAFDDFFQLLMEKKGENDLSTLPKSVGDHTLVIGTTLDGKGYLCINIKKAFNQCIDSQTSTGKMAEKGFNSVQRFFSLKDVVCKVSTPVEK